VDTEPPVLVVNFNELIKPQPQLDPWALCRDTGISHQVVNLTTKWVSVCGADITHNVITGYARWDNRPTVGKPCSECYPRRVMSCAQLCGISECDTNGCAITALKDDPDELVTPLLLLEEIRRHFNCVECGPHRGCINEEPTDMCMAARFVMRTIELLKDQK